MLKKDDKKKTMQNYFDHQEAAKRYKKGRPVFHALVVDKIKTHLNIEKKLPKCLDVACGTGLLTKALLEISEKVIGLDNSKEMLNHAEQDERITYIYRDAEKLEIIKDQVDLITVSSAFHWFNQNAFLKSCSLKLPIGNYITVHNNFFTSKTTDEKSDEFTNWMSERYLKKFISPKRNRYSVEESEMRTLDFVISANEQFENIVSFGKENLIDYLITQSNVISNVEMGNYTIDEVKNWLGKELNDHFEEDVKRDFRFGNRLIFLKRQKV